MKSVDFHGMFGGCVECPECGQDIELDICEVQYVTGEEVTCPECECEFILGESL